MAKLKSSYELAMERIIRSTYKKDKERQQEYDDPLSGVPDFVEAWKHPDGPQEHQSLMLEDSETQSFIEEYDALEGKKPHVETKKEEIKRKEEEIKVIDPIKISYGDNENPELHWYGHFTSYTGFSRMNRAFAFGLSNKGIAVKLDVQESERQVNTSTLAQLDKMENTRVSDKAPKVFGATIPLNMFHGGRKILYTMMENSETLHPDYVGRLNLFNEIWVPTNFAKAQFKKNNVNPPIHVMPLGVDTKRYTTDRKSYDFNQELNGFVFLSVFKWGYRKGYDILLKSFLEEFSSTDNVTLLIVSRAEHSNDPDQIFKDFAAVRSSVGKSDEDLPHIALFDEEIPERDMPKIYGSADAFALISRGEGFGLPYCEAGASGLPVIASNCSGHSDFLDETNSFLVEPEGYIEASTNGQLSKIAKLCHFYEGQKFPDFGAKAISQTKDHMRYVFENYDEALVKADKFRNDLEENYTWEKSVDRVYKRVLELNGR